MNKEIFTTKAPSGQEIAFMVQSKEDKTVSVAESPNASGNLVIPSTVTINGETYAVTAIGSHAFYCCSLTSITIPDSVTSIGEFAFYYCRGLTSITIGNSVTTIGEAAFKNCSGLASITIPDSITEIGSYAFYYCSGLTSITIGNSVTSIGEFAFYYCSGLTSITIGNSVTTIGSHAFSDCNGLTSITIPDSVTTIGSGAFMYCRGLTSKLGNSKKYYKGFKPGLTCRGYRFQEGVVNELNSKEKKISVCEYGFHFCNNPLSVFDYYSGIDGEDMELWEVESMGEIAYGDDHKHCCSKIRLVRRIPFSEIGKIVEEGLKNSCQNQEDFR